MRPVCVSRNPLVLNEILELTPVPLPVVVSILHLHLGSVFSEACSS